MALTITIEGKGVIANSDSLTADTAGGIWSENGGGAISLSTETYLYGTNCVAGAYSNKSGFHYYDIGSGSELDFTATTGAEADQLIYMWVFFPTPGLGETQANGGFKIRIGTDLTNYREYMVSASDNLNGWYGDWKCFVVDPNKPGTVTDTGTFNIASVRYFGCYLDATNTAKGDNLFIDQIAVGKGLRITGTSTTGWKDIIDYCTDYPNRAWGMAQERDGIYYIYGNIYIGGAVDGDGTANNQATSFSDSGRIIQFADTEYYYSTGWASTMPTTANGIVVEDTASYATTFSDGVIVGTDNGRSGSSIIGNPNQNVSLDLYGGNNAGSVTTLYGTAIKNCTGTISSGNDADHKFLGCSFLISSQFDPVGAPVIRNCTFAETTDVDSALLWNESIDIQYCNFIANTLGAGIEHPSAVGTPYSHVGLLFSGNTDDVLNSSGSAITIDNTGGANGSSSEGSAVTFQTAINLNITVQDDATDPIATAQVAIYKISDRTQLMNEDTNASGLATQSYSGGAADIEVRVRKSSTGATRYFPVSTLGTTGTSDFNLLVTLKEDTNA